MSTIRNVRFTISNSYLVNAYKKLDGFVRVTIRHPNVGYFQSWFRVTAKGRFIAESSVTKKWVLGLNMPAFLRKLLTGN